MFFYLAILSFSAIAYVRYVRVCTSTRGEGEGTRDKAEGIMKHEQNFESE